MENIKNILIDYENGILIINGRFIELPVKIAVKGEEGFDKQKIINCELVKPGDKIPELFLDATEVMQRENEKTIDFLLKAMKRILE